MSRLLPSLYLLAAILLSCGCQKKDLGEADRIFESLRSRYAPDKRVALFEVSFTRRAGKVLVSGSTNLPEAKQALFDSLGAAGISLVDSLVVLPEPTLRKTPFGIVNLSVANLRSTPKHSAELSTQALLGMVLRVWKKDGDFYLVQTPDDYLGWMDDGGFVLIDSARLQSYLRSPRVVCIDSYAFVFEEPRLTSPKVSDLVAGDIMEATGVEREGFYEIKFPDGRQGYVPSSSCMPIDRWLSRPDPRPEDILSAAVEMMGRPYLWGGTSGKGMDCSGFTKMCYLLNGVQIARDASQQVRYGELLPRDTTFSNLEPADLVFFGRPASDSLPEKIWHVAIYIGDGKIIHASDRVQIESLKPGTPGFNKDRFDTWVKTRRILSTIGTDGIVRLREHPLYIGEMQSRVFDGRQD